MNKLRLAVLLITAMVSATAFTGCKEKEDKKVVLDSSFTQLEEIGKNKHETNLGKSLTVEKTTFQVNNVIDVNETTEDGEKYIFIDYTIKNDSDAEFKMSNINNFYIMIDDVKYNPDVRAKIFAKQSINGYVDTESIQAGAEVTNYVGFIIPADTTEITFGYYVTEDNVNSKEDTIICSVSNSEWIQPPAGMLK